MAEASYQGTGKRKTAVARVIIRPGAGQIMVNKKPLADYFCTPAQRHMVCQPLEHLHIKEQFNVSINVRGGGPNGQAGASRHGIARALLHIESENYRAELKPAGFLTRDARQVERKKYGQPGARKRYQFSKR